MPGRILIGCWVTFWAFVFLLILRPRLAAQIPHLEYIRPILIVLVIASCVYAVAWIYQRGMKRNKGK